MSALTIEGTIDHCIYHNGENGYTVFSVTPEEGDEVVCVAFMDEPSGGEHVSLTGQYVVHASYGRQFNVATFERKIPTTLSGIQKYLGSGAVKGVGEALAKRIVQKFGEETLQVIEEYPEKLAEVKGITMSKAVSISQTYKEQSTQRNIIMALNGFGISHAYAKKLYDKYKDDTIVILKANPYIIADEIWGIGFKIADDIAVKMGIQRYDPLRIAAGLKFVLSQSVGSGHTCIPKELFIAEACGKLEAETELVENAMLQLQFDRSICLEKNEDGTQMVYLNAYFYAESYAAKKLLELCVGSAGSKGLSDEELDAVEQDTGVTLAAQQRQAVREALTAGVLIITGGPGTGKTTIINAIIKLLEKRGSVVELCAPTGRAAKCMTETTGHEAKTIHRLLGVSFSDDDKRRQSFSLDEENPIDADAVIVDESSMIDLMLMHHLLKAIKAGTKVIFVGDADQLPSVGAGNVLRDMIDSGVINTVKLNEIFRQSGESAIIVNAHRINAGQYPALNDTSGDFFMVKRPVQTDCADTIISLVKDRLPAFLKVKPRDIQVLSPMRKSPLGILSLNAALQRAVNPPDYNKNERQRPNSVFREQDKVIQIKNNYNLPWKIIRNGKVAEENQGVFNGDEGIISSINDEEEKLCVIFDENKHVSYDYSQLDELELSYAITVHKSQGSEYGVVVIPVHSGPHMLMNRNILYTAVTRARKMVVLVGTEEALRKMVDNNRQIERFSTLKRRLQKLKDMFG